MIPPRLSDEGLQEIRDIASGKSEYFPDEAVEFLTRDLRDLLSHIEWQDELIGRLSELAARNSGWSEFPAEVLERLQQEAV